MKTQETSKLQLDGICPKCGYYDLNLTYQQAEEAMAIDCLKCGYRWAEKSYKPVEAEKSRLTFHAELCQVCGKVVFAGRYEPAKGKLVKECKCGHRWEAKPLDAAPKEFDIDQQTPDGYWGSVRRLTECKIREVLKGNQAERKQQHCSICRGVMDMKCSASNDKAEYTCRKCGWTESKES